MYWEALIETLPAALEPGLSTWLFKHRCHGTQEILDFTQPNLKYEATIRRHHIINLSAFFDIDDKESIEPHLLQWLHDRSHEAHVTWQIRATQDWLKEWKKHFKPITVAGLKVIPAWYLPKPPKLKPSLTDTIVIEPGMAFGTGTHATTRFAMEMIRFLEEAESLNGANVLDVGAGSGILAVAAERLGAKEIVAIDNDPEAWRECRKTFKLNKTRKCLVTEKQLHQIKKKYDVVIANIIDGVLMDLREQLWNVAKTGGYIILSGILADGARAFKRDFLRGTSGRVIHELTDGEWTSLLISK